MLRWAVTALVAVLHLTRWENRMSAWVLMTNSSCPHSVHTADSPIGYAHFGQRPVPPENPVHLIVHRLALGV